MSTHRRIRLGLSDKISLTVIAVGVLGLILVFYTSIYYRNIAHEHHQRTLQILATIKVEEIVNTLQSNAADLARAITQHPDFQQHLSANQPTALAAVLDEQFYQYFVTANIVDLAKLYVFDTGFNLISASNEGIKSASSPGLICPQLSRSAARRTGAERLQLIAGTCKHGQRPVFVLISPYGGLKPAGYIQIVISLASSLRQLETALGMPIQIHLPNGEVSYQSADWAETIAGGNHIPVTYALGTHDDEDAVSIVFLADMTPFNQRVLTHRNWVMALATLAIAATVALILYLLQSSTITPLSRIQRTLNLISQNPQPSTNDHSVLFAQLLENIITLQKNRKQRFAVMILDLDNFEAVNQQFGHDAGTELLKHVGNRLSSIIRDSDTVSWTGTDTPGHKLLPAGTKTEYRATLARLGGDEFGMLLPSVQNEQQAASVAERVTDLLSSDYTFKNQKVTLRCRIGISLYPDHGQRAEELIRNADKAMLEAKQDGGKYCIYSAKTL
jgi:GGDEF domain-containing protein